MFTPRKQPTIRRRPSLDAYFPFWGEYFPAYVSMFTPRKQPTIRRRPSLYAHFPFWGEYFPPTCLRSPLLSRGVFFLCNQAPYTTTTPTSHVNVHPSCRGVTFFFVIRHPTPLRSPLMANPSFRAFFFARRLDFIFYF
jgi:hypothetical protein